MNPALPALLLLSLAPLAVRRRGVCPGWARAWALCGVAAMVLLAPSLAIPDGVPSPAATLERLAPWQGAPPEIDPATGNPHLRDVTHQVQPWLLFLRSELREGRLPYWNPHQFAGTPFWSNGSSAPLFPLHLVFAALPVQIGLVLLPWLRLVIGGVGAFALARALRASERGALVAAVAFPLSGVVASWMLYPMANCHALIPWVLWATERIARRPAAWPWLAALGGLQLLGGHPETPVFTGMLAALYLLVRWSARPLAAWGAFAGAWATALALAAIQLAPLAATVFRSSKWLVEQPSTPVPLPVIGELLLRLVLPELHGNPAPTPWAAGSWWGPFNYPATAIYGGALTLPLAAAGLAVALRGLRRGPAGASDDDRGDARRWAAVGAFTLFALLAAYQVPGVRHLLTALPVIDKSLTHYIKFGLDLGLALLAARGTDAWLAGRHRRALALGAAAVGALLGLCWILFAGDWAGAGLTGAQLGWTAGIVVAALALLVASRLPAERRGKLFPLLPALLVCDLALAHAWTNPGLSAQALYPETGAVRFLRHRAGPLERIAGTGAVFHPNAAMVHGLHDVRGDTPVKLHHYQELYASFASPHPVFFRPIERWDHAGLDRLGVAWVITGPDAPSPGTSPRPWRLVYEGPDARVYRRPGALPLVRWRGPEGASTADGLEVLERSPGRWIVRSEAPEGLDPPATLVVAETWDPGWRVRIDDEPVPRNRIERIDGALLGVRLARPRSGRLELTYRPEWMEAGVGLSLSGLVVLLGGAAWARREGPPLSPPG